MSGKSTSPDVIPPANGERALRNPSKSEAMPYLEIVAKSMAKTRQNPCHESLQSHGLIEVKRDLIDIFLTRFWISTTTISNLD